MTSDAGDAEDEDPERTTASRRRRESSGDEVSEITVRRPRPVRTVSTPFPDEPMGARRSEPSLPPESVRRASSPARLLHPQYPARQLREGGGSAEESGTRTPQPVVDGEAIDRAVRAKALRRAAVLGVSVAGMLAVAVVLLVLFLLLPR